MKPSNVQVLMLRDLNHGIPRGKYRKYLATDERIKKLEFTRSMSSSQVKTVISEGFKHLPGFSEFVLLEADSHGQLHMSKNQKPDGQYIIESARRRSGAIYLCENKVCTYKD